MSWSKHQVYPKKNTQVKNRYLNHVFECSTGICVLQSTSDFNVSMKLLNSTTYKFMVGFVQSFSKGGHNVLYIKIMKHTRKKKEGIKKHDFSYLFDQPIWSDLTHLYVDTWSEYNQEFTQSK